jgi:hypothetical protein
MHLMGLLGDEAQVEAQFGTLEIVLLLMQDWTHPMKLISDVGHVQSHFSLFGDSVSVSAR